MFQVLHDFWVEQLPMFQGTFEIFYVVMDCLTIILFFRLLFALGSIVPGGNR